MNEQRARSRSLPCMTGYFDYNATAPLHPAASSAWLEANERHWQNPSSLYPSAAAARTALEDCRERAADLLGCDAEHLIFMSGATEANNAVLHHFSGRDCGGIAISAIEHPAVREPATCLWQDRLITIPVEPGGTIDFEAFEKILVEQKPAFVSVMAANNETGVLQPWSAVQHHCARHGVAYHCDAAQWVGKMPSSGLGACDFITVSAHKFGGPKGIGLLKVNPAFGPLRWMRGGPQEDRRRAGTENLPAIAAMLAAWETLESSAASQSSEGRDAFEQKLKRDLPGIEFVAQSSPRLWNTSLCIVPTQTNVKWLTRLARAGFSRR